VGTKTATRIVLGAGGAISAAAAFLIVASSAVGQTAPRLEPRPDILSSDIGRTEQVLVATQDETSSRTIDFENVQGRQVGVGIELRDQFEKTHGLSFARGASVHFCARVTDDVNASLCPYPRAASGQRAAAHDVRTGGSAMVMNFSRPIEAISMRINPTGGKLDEVFVAELVGSDARGNKIVDETIRFNWFQDAFTWPTSVGFETDGAQISRVTVMLRRVSQNNQPVRFLIDDLSLLYSPEQNLSPVMAELEAQQNPVNVRDPEIIETQRGDVANDTPPYFPVATRIRTRIDWEAAEAAVIAQNARGLIPATLFDEADFDRMALPALLPIRSDRPVVLIAQPVGDSYDALYTIDGRRYELSGTRLATLIGAANDAPGVTSNLMISGYEEAIEASFSIYGAIYTLSRYCHSPVEDEDPQCHDEGALRAALDEVVVAIGAAGKVRP